MSSSVALRSKSYRQARELNWIRPGGGLTVFVGENGAGKSRLLEHIAVSSLRGHSETIVVSNTPFSRFTNARGAHRLVRTNAAEVALKRAISNSELKDELKTRKISRILYYCGYRQDLGIKVCASPDKRRTRADLEVIGRFSPEEQKEILALGELLLRSDVADKIVWFDFDSFNPDYSYRSLIPKFVRWEGVLKKMGLLRRVDLFLERDGSRIPLRKASSGQLSLIATMAFLSSLLSRGAVVVIDEPENSLHPRWQREYIDLLLEITKYWEANIFIATHSPLIVSEMELDGVNGPASIVILKPEQEPGRLGSVAPDSVEGILTEIFDTVTPKNHYLSRKLVEMLDLAERRVSSSADLVQALDHLRSIGLDERQLVAVNATERMIQEIMRREA